MDVVGGDGEEGGFTNGRSWEVAASIWRFGASRGFGAGLDVGHSRVCLDGPSLSCRRKLILQTAK